MRTFKVLAAALAALACGSAPAAAQDECTPTVAKESALGVSRTVEIDASQGPLFGVQYKDHSFLTDGEVVLTFDDGPLRAYSIPVLEALAAHCTKATFFLVGRMAVADPGDGQGDRPPRALHRHAYLVARQPAGVERGTGAREIELGFSAVQKALGKPIAPFFRFPYLSDPRGMIAHLKGRQIGVFSIDVDSKDFRTRDPGTVHRKVMGELARAHKGIILFHDIQPSTARALPGLLAELKAKGYRVVHMVPKAEATTVAEFDGLAEHALARKRAAASAHPLVKRSLTWPVSGSLPREPASVAAAETNRPVRRARRAVRHRHRETWPSSKAWMW